MPRNATLDDQARARELMMYVARSPRFCGGCICLSHEDEKRAKRVFRIVRVVTHPWKAIRGHRRRPRAFAWRLRAHRMEQAFERRVGSLFGQRRPPSN